MTTPSKQTHFPLVLAVVLKDNITAHHQAFPSADLALGASADEADSEVGEDEVGFSEVQTEENIGEAVADDAIVAHQAEARRQAS